MIWFFFPLEDTFNHVGYVRVAQVLDFPKKFPELGVFLGHCVHMKVSIVVMLWH